jgi:hypothetical protein
MLIAAFVCGVENGEDKREKSAIDNYRAAVRLHFPLTVTELIANH